MFICVKCCDTAAALGEENGSRAETLRPSTRPFTTKSVR